MNLARGKWIGGYRQNTGDEAAGNRIENLGRVVGPTQLRFAGRQPVPRAELCVGFLYTLWIIRSYKQISMIAMMLLKTVGIPYIFLELFDHRSRWSLRVVDSFSLYSSNIPFMAHSMQMPFVEDGCIYQMASFRIPGVSEQLDGRQYNFSREVNRDERKRISGDGSSGGCSACGSSAAERDKYHDL